MEPSKEVKVYLKHQKKLKVLEYAKRSGSVAKALKEFKVSKATYYKWKKIFEGWNRWSAYEASKCLQSSE